jgi:hypothetical protein
LALTLLLTGCYSTYPSPPPAAQRYPSYDEVAFLNHCEAGASASFCACALYWLEWHIPASEAISDGNYYGSTGISPSYIPNIRETCGGLL